MIGNSPVSNRLSVVETKKFAEIQRCETIHPPSAHHLPQLITNTIVAVMHDNVYCNRGAFWEQNCGHNQVYWFDALFTQISNSGGESLNSIDAVIKSIFNLRYLLLQALQESQNLVLLIWSKRRSDFTAYQFCYNGLGNITDCGLN